MDYIQKISLRMVKEDLVDYNGNKLKSVKVSSPDVIFDLMHLIGLHESPEEKFIVLCLDTKNNISDFFVVSHGSVNASIVHPRDVFKRALLSNSTSILLIHNHPTGNTKPSKNDKKRTQRLVDGGEILGINVLDHLIIGDYNYYSFKENNLL